MAWSDFWTKLIDILNFKRRFPPPFPPRPTPSPTPGPSVAGAVVAEINRARVLRGLHPLLADPRIDTISQDWAENLAEQDILSHGDVSSRIASIYPEVPWGEDIATGSSAKDVVASWLADPQHKAIILGNFNHVGVGIALSRSGWSYWVVDFALV